MSRVTWSLFLIIIISPSPDIIQMSVQHSCTCSCVGLKIMLTVFMDIPVLWLVQYSYFFFVSSYFFLVNNVLLHKTHETLLHKSSSCLQWVNKVNQMCKGFTGTLRHLKGSFNEVQDSAVNGSHRKPA